MISIGHGRRLATLVAVTTGVALWTLAAPASALTVTIPTLPAPLPTLPLPTSASVSGGTGGAPIGVSVNGPGSTGIDVQLPGLPTPPALPIGPTGPVTAPIASSPPTPAPAPPPASPASGTAPAPSGGSNPSVAIPGDRAAPSAASPLTAGAAEPIAPAGPQGANVGASINARPADSLLQRIPTIATRVALWVALAGVVFVLQMLIGSALRQHRRKSVRIS